MLLNSRDPGNYPNCLKFQRNLTRLPRPTMSDDVLDLASGVSLKCAYVEELCRELIPALDQVAAIPFPSLLRLAHDMNVLNACH